MQETEEARKNETKKKKMSEIHPTCLNDDRCHCAASVNVSLIMLQYLQQVMMIK